MSCATGSSAWRPRRLQLLERTQHRGRALLAEHALEPVRQHRPAQRAAPADIAGTIQGLSGFKRTGYRGPAPPPGKPHHYTWTVYALDAELPLDQGLNRNQLLDAMKGHIIGQGSLVAIYERKPKQ